MSLAAISLILGIAVFLTIVALYAWMVKRFGAKRMPELGAERKAALEEYRRSLAKREER